MSKRRFDQFFEELMDDYEKYGTDHSISSAPDAKPPPFFQWIVEGKIAAFAYPSKPYHIKWLLSSGIRHLVTLQTYPKPPIGRFPELGWTKIAVREFEAPQLDQIKEFITTLDKELDAGHPVGIHCTFGRGRTGTMLAAYFVHKEGLTAEKAVEKIRSIRPYSVETYEQEEAVHFFAKSLNRENTEEIKPGPE